MKIILVKVGGSSITVKKDLETLDEAALQWFSRTVAQSVHTSYLSDPAPPPSHNSDSSADSSNETNNGKKYCMVIVHGAGSFGHHLAKEYGLRGQNQPPAQDLGTSEIADRTKMMTGLVRTRHSVKKLSSAVVSHLMDEGVNAIGLSPCMNIPGLLAHGGDEYGGVTTLVRAIQQALMAGIVPVIHGDAGLYGLLDKEMNSTSSEFGYRRMSAGILGGDTLVEIIASHPELRPNIEKVIFLTDVEGVYTQDPKINSDAVLVKEIRVDPETGSFSSLDICASKSTHDHDVTGGLETKLSAAVKVARLGIDVSICKCCSISAEHVIKGNEENMSAGGTTIKAAVL